MDLHLDLDLDLDLDADLDLDVDLAATVADQEVPPIPYGNLAAAYWEGRVEVIDSVTGATVGKAFAELSGYVDAPPLEWRR